MRSAVRRRGRIWAGAAGVALAALATAAAWLTLTRRTTSVIARGIRVDGSRARPGDASRERQPAHITEEDLPRARHETRDVPLRPILIGSAVMAVLLVGILGFAYWLFPGATVDKTLPRPIPTFPAPALQASPRSDMDAFRDAQLKWLYSTGWSDEAHTRVHLDIRDAMRRVARDGIPGWPAAPSAAGPVSASVSTNVPRNLLNSAVAPGVPPGGTQP